MDELSSAVREKYRQAADRVRRGAKAACCETNCGETGANTSTLYDDSQIAGVPVKAMLASLGCGNPTALAELRPGETVLDLGSGGGIDVLLSARRVGPAGRAYGLDVTDEMIALARENAVAAGLNNVEFLKGEIERIPLPDNSVDVVISNCVINLSPDKDRVFADVFRVLKPGGRLAISDVVADGPVPEAIRRDVELWADCVAGALETSVYRDKLAEAGFESIGVEPWRVYDLGPGTFVSAFIRARKPAARECCGPHCCSG